MLSMFAGAFWPSAFPLWKYVYSVILHMFKSSCFLDVELYEKPCANKIDSLEEIDGFLERHNIPKLNQKEIRNMKNYQ